MAGGWTSRHSKFVILSVLERCSKHAVLLARPRNPPQRKTGDKAA